MRTHSLSFITISFRNNNCCILKLTLPCLFRIQSLQSEVRTLRAKEHEDTVTMERAIEQAEENLQRTMVRPRNVFYLLL